MTDERSAAKPGAGDHLHDIIAERFGAESDASCGCGSLAARMNGWGPDGCRARMSEIVAALADNAESLRGWRGWAARRSLARPLVEAEAAKMVGEAIARTEASA